jgi:aminoglycoside 2''-phosphotransferase
MQDSGSPPLQRILQVIPDLTIASVRAGEDGLVNDVLIVNEELVFRFAREEAARPALEREAQLLAFLRPRLPLPVPELIQQHPDCTVYRFIPGVPLDRRRVLAQDATTRQGILEELGAFLHELHSLPASAAEAITGPATSFGTRQDYERLYEAAERELLPQMMAWARDWVRQLFRPMFEGDLALTFAPAIIHGDLAPYHLCFDPATGRLNGVIDFGSAGAGDRALDLGSIIAAFGETLLQETESVYPEMSACIDRARFHAATLELRWALAALRSRDPAWFLCHLGYARDAWPVGWPGKRARQSHHGR